MSYFPSSPIVPFPCRPMVGSTLLVSAVSCYMQVNVNIPHLDNTLRCNRLRWIGHVQRSQTWTGGCLSLVVEGRREKKKERKTTENLERLSMRIFAFLASFWIWQRTGINGKRYYVMPYRQVQPLKGKSDFKCIMTMLMMIHEGSGIF